MKPLLAYMVVVTSAPFAVVSGGIGCLIVLAVVALKLPELRHYRIEHHRAQPA